MNEVIKDLESRKKGEKFFDFCIDDAIFHIRKAQEILEAAEEDSQDWYKQQQDVTKTFIQLIPFLLSSNCTKSADSFH